MAHEEYPSGVPTEGVKTFFEIPGRGAILFENIQALMPSETRHSGYETGTTLLFKNGISFTMNSSEAGAKRLMEEFSIYLAEKKNTVGPWHHILGRCWGLPRRLSADNTLLERRNRHGPQH